ncbi:hypothetical protein [Nocardioides scoriae]|uniref:hypothetical protein n=1 Tax=Nocardioides scoriae TaxID=642780 RepID=UPI0012FA5B80|nr:hypothetical protein [Nocardioides scoriae]
MSAEMASALTGALTLLAAIWAGVTATRLYRVEQERDRARVAAERRSQAEQFAGWVSWVPQPHLAIDLPEGLRSPNLALRNANSVPVYDVTVRYFHGDIPAGEQSFSVISPTDSDTQHREIKSETMREVLLQPRPAATRLDLRVALSFTDARGRRWERDRQGRLRDFGTEA